MNKKTVEQTFTEQIDRQGTAYHEAGHAVWATLLGLPFTTVTVKRRGRTYGQVSYPRSRKEYRGYDLGRVHVAGSVAQDIFFGEDLHDVGCGADKQLLVNMNVPGELLSWQSLKNEVRAITEGDLVIWSQIEDVATALLKQQTLTSQQVDRICRKTRRDWRRQVQKVA